MAEVFTFNFTGAEQTWVVPAGVSSVEVDVQGAQGGGQNSSGTDIGGKGGRVTATLAVTPGETLRIYVGGKGPVTSAGGYNGGGLGTSQSSSLRNGGGGGGASDIRRGGSALADRVVVAGGGGGRGGQTTGSSGNRIPGGGGGGGGGYYGGGGGDDGAGTETGRGGFGASQTAGGAGSGFGGSAGTLGQGGDGQTAGNSGLSIDFGPGSAGGVGGGLDGGNAPTSNNGSGGGGGGGSAFAGTGTSSVVHTSDHRAGDGLVVITVLNNPPTAPTLTAPADGSSADLDDTPTFEAIYNDPDVDSISAFYFRRKISGAGSYEYWNATTGAWQSTEVKNADAGVAVGETWGYTFPTASWVNGNTYNWSVAFEDAAGVKGPYASDATVNAVAPATYTVTAPTGTVTDTSRPTTVFSRSHPTGVPQTRFRVRIFDQATYEAGGFDPATAVPVDESGWIVSETLREWTGEEDLANGGTYRTYVQGEQTGSVQSAWAFATFTLALTPPAAPTVAVTPHPDEARVEVTITGQHDDLAFPSVTYRLQRTIDGGTTWTTVRGAGALVPDGSLVAVVDDLEAPPHQPVGWRAYAVADV